MVMGLRQTVEIEVMGLKQEIPLSFADGMIGAIPVFETYEEAEKYADGILEIVSLQDKGVVGEKI